MTEHRTLRRTYRCRVSMTAAAHNQLDSLFRDCAALYNAALEERTDCYRKTGRTITYYDQCKSLTEIRRDLDGFSDLSLQVQRGVLARLDRAFQAFFARVKHGDKPGFPRFRSARRWHSIELAEVSPTMVRSRDGCVTLTVKGLPAFRLLPTRELPPPADLAALRIIRYARRTEVHLTFAVPAAEPKKIENPVGIDMGIAARITFSDGTAIDRRFTCPKRVRRLQRAVSRSRKGSHQRRKRASALRREHERQAEANRQHLHRISSDLCHRYDGFAVEDLQIQNMTRRARDKGVAAKSGLNKAIVEQSWAMAVRLLADKAESAGLRVERVAPHGTSQGCSGCGAVVPKSLRVRVHRCPDCGLVLDRDVNAARNILLRSGLTRAGNSAGGASRGDGRMPPLAAASGALALFAPERYAAGAENRARSSI